MDLATKKCVPCQGGIPPMELGQAQQLLKQLNGAWLLNTAGHLERTFAFSNFKKAMDFANWVTQIAEEEGHHPDLYIAWGKCRVEIWTHKINGLNESDFILAAKIDRIP